MPGSNYKTRLNWKQPAPIPESSSTNRPPSLHSYDFKDINRWLDKIDNYLKLCRIPSARPTTLAELVTNLASPAEDLCYSIPSNKKETYANLRDSLGERFANDNQSWVIWQVVSRRQQRAMKTLDTYLTDWLNPSVIDVNAVALYSITEPIINLMKVSPKRNRSLVVYVGRSACS